MKQNTNKRKGIAKKAISVSLVAAMLATTNVPVWADTIIEDVSTAGVEEMAPAANLAGVVSGMTLTAGTANTVEVENKADIEWGSKIVAAVTGASSATYTWSAVQGGESVTLAASATGTSGEVYTPEAGDIGKTITCSIEYTDDQGTYTVEKSVNIVPANLDSNDVTIAVPDCTYNGKEQKPAVTVSAAKNQFGDAITTPAVDIGYTVDYGNNTEPAAKTDDNAPYAAVVFKGDYTGTVVKNFTIAGVTTGTIAITLKDNQKVTYSPVEEDYEAALQAAVDKVEYTPATGDPVTLTPADYTLELTTNAAGDQTVTVKGQGHYAATITNDSTETITVEPRDLSTCTLAPIKDQPYKNGAPVELQAGDIVLTYGDVTLTSGTDYDAAFDYAKNYLVGSATVTVKAKANSNYTGSITGNYNIVAAGLDGLKTEMIAEIVTGKNYTYNGKAQEPVIQSYTDAGGVVYLLNRDFTYSYSNNTNAGTATITVNGAGSYAGKSFTLDFEIGKYNMSGLAGAVTAKTATVTVAPTSYDATATIANAASIYGVPAVGVVLNGKTLQYGVDYTLGTCDYSGILNNKKINMVIKGVGQNFEGETGAGEFYSEISQKNIANVTAEEIAPQKFTGYAITPKVVLKDGEKTLTEGTDYTVEYKNNKAVGQASIVITGKKNSDYTGTKTVYFQIVQNEINAYILDGTNTTINEENQKLKESPVYTYNDSISEDGFTLIDGTDFTVVDKSGNKLNKTDYTVKYENNRAAGIAAITVTSKKSGLVISAANTFEIKPNKLPSGTVTGTVASLPYTGEAVTMPELKYQGTDGKYTLVEGKDFKYEYENNVEVGVAAKAKIVGLGNYAGEAGTIVNTFEITKADLDKGIKIAPTAPYAGGMVVEPEVTVSNPATGKALVKGTDYTVAYTDNAAIGTATATVTLTTDAAKSYAFSGANSKAVTFDIIAFNFANAEVTPIEDQVYTGKAIEPEVTVMAGNVRLTKDVDYKVTYAGNTEPGKATITITPVKGVEGYYGTKTVNFNIVKPVEAPAAPKNVKVTSTTTSMTISWSAVEGATGYVVYAYADANLGTTPQRFVVSGTSKTLKYVQGTVKTLVVRAYKTIDGKNVYCKAADAVANKVTTAVKPNVSKISKVTPGKGIAKVAVTAGKGAKDFAYCVSYDGGKTYTIIAKGPKNPYIMKGLKKGKATIRVRGYVRNHDGVSVYGAWSNAVNVTIK